MTDPLTDRHPRLEKVLALGLWGLDMDPDISVMGQRLARNIPPATADRLEAVLGECVVCARGEAYGAHAECSRPGEHINGDGFACHPYQPLSEVAP